MEKEINGSKAVIIGGSAGSLKVILTLLTKLKKDLFLPVIIIIHRKDDPGSGMADLLRQAAVLPVKEAEDKEDILPGIVYLAPAGYHLLVEQNHSFSLDSSEKVHFSRPSIDVSFQTAAEAYRSGLLAILLSGANEDGTKGLEEIRRNNGLLVIQDPLTAEVPFMPQNAIRQVGADHVLPVEGIIRLIEDFGSKP